MRAAQLGSTTFVSWSLAWTLPSGKPMERPTLKPRGAVLSRETPSPEQAAAFLALARKDELVAQQDPKEWSDDRILRYLSAHKLDPDVALAKAKETIAYLSGFDWSFDQLADVPKEFQELDAKGELFWLPYRSPYHPSLHSLASNTGRLNGNPILVWKTKLHDPGFCASEVNVRWLVYVILKAMHHNVLTDRIYLLVDRNNVCFFIFFY